MGADIKAGVKLNREVAPAFFKKKKKEEGEVMVRIYPDDVCWRCHKDYADCECPSYKELDQENIELKEYINELEKEVKEAFEAGQRIEREKCAEIAEYNCLYTRCNAVEASGVVRTTRKQIAQAIRKRGEND